MTASWRSLKKSTSATGGASFSTTWRTSGNRCITSSRSSRWRGWPASTQPGDNASVLSLLLVAQPACVELFDLRAHKHHGAVDIVGNQGVILGPVVDRLPFDPEQFLDLVGPHELLFGNEAGKGSIEELPKWLFVKVLREAKALRTERMAEERTGRAVQESWDAFLRWRIAFDVVGDGDEVAAQRAIPHHLRRVRRGILSQRDRHAAQPLNGACVGQLQRVRDELFMIWRHVWHHASVCFLWSLLTCSVPSLSAPGWHA